MLLIHIICLEVWLHGCGTGHWFMAPVSARWNIKGWLLLIQDERFFTTGRRRLCPFLVCPLGLWKLPSEYQGTSSVPLLYRLGGYKAHPILVYVCLCFSLHLDADCVQTYRLCLVLSPGHLLAITYIICRLSSCNGPKIWRPYFASKSLDPKGRRTLPRRK